MTALAAVRLPSAVWS